MCIVKPGNRAVVKSNFVDPKTRPSPGERSQNQKRFESKSKWLRVKNSLWDYLLTFVVMLEMSMLAL